MSAQQPARADPITAAAVTATFARDCADFGFAATRAVLHNLATAMLIKDAFFKAEVSTSPEKYARDREKYNVNPAKGDRISYRSLLPTTLKIGSRELHFDLAAPDWAFKLLKRMKWLRAVLPMWHRNERKYLAQYEARLAAFAPTIPPPITITLAGATPGTPASKIPRPSCGRSKYFAPCWMLMRPATSLIGVSSGRFPFASRIVS
jgi:hypothetical protein